MAAVMAPSWPTSTSPYATIAEAGELAGLKTQGIYKAISRGRLHPMRFKGTRLVLFQSEILAWRNRYRWRPTPEELTALVASGYKAEDFTPATPGELAASQGASQGASSMGGAPEASGALVSPADVLAYVQVLSQSATTGAREVGGEVAERAMRPFAEALQAGATVDVAALSRAAGDMAAQAMRPLVESFSENIAPLTEAMAQAALPRPTPPAEDVVARQMGALRVELAQLLTRIMEAIRPMVERLASGGYVTSDDIAPFMGLVGELALSLAGSPFYDMAPRDAPALMPGMLAQAIADGASQTPATTPAPDAGKE